MMLRHANDEPLVLDVDQSIELIKICLLAWNQGLDTMDMAKIASFRIGRVIPESFVANVLADHWSQAR